MAKANSKRVDPLGAFLAEYLSGYRCTTCNSVRDDKGLCDHERQQLFEDQQFEIEAWQRKIGADPDNRRSNALYGSAASSLRRSGLQAGKREDIGDVMAEHRGRATGKVMEWRPHQRPSGDELPL